jgi:hypothetical protein
MVLWNELGNVAAVRADYHSNSTQASCTRELGDMHLANSATSDRAAVRRRLLADWPS